jgi:hypothetical protein
MPSVQKIATYLKAIFQKKKQEVISKTWQTPICVNLFKGFKSTSLLISRFCLSFTEVLKEYSS